MKIAILTVIVNRKSGSRAPLEIAKVLAKLEHEVTVIAYDWRLEKEAAKELKDSKVSVVLLKKHKVLTPIKLAKLLRDGGYDVISFHGDLPIFLGAKISAIPIVRTYYGSQLDPILDKSFPNKPTLAFKLLNALANLYVKSTEKFILTNSKEIVAISKYTKKELKKLYSVNADYVYLGSAPKNFGKAILKADGESKKASEVSLLSVSRLVPYKGFHKLIAAFNKLNKKFPNIRLTLIGSAPQKGYLNHLKRLKNANTKILVGPSDKQLAEAYTRADIYASFDRYMFFGMPILEAATFSVPAVAIAKCAAVETIEHGNTGYLAKNEVEFERSLARLIKNPKLRTKMGRKAKLKSSDFSWEDLGKKYSSIFSEVLSRKNSNSDLHLLPVIILGAIVRLLFLNKHSFWFDEKASLFVANQPLSGLFTAAARDTHPPLYFLLLKFWSTISTDLLYQRLLSVILGTLSIYVAYKVFSKLTNQRVTNLALLLFTLSPLLVYYSTEIRMYSLLLLTTLLAVRFYLKFIKTKETRDLFFLFLAATAALYTHYYAAYAILGINVAFFSFKKATPLRKKWILSQTATALSFLPWLLFALRFSKPGCWCFNPIVGIPATFASFNLGGLGIVTLKDYILYRPEAVLWLFVFTSSLTFVLFVRGLLVAKKVKRTNLALFFFTPLLLATLVGFLLPLYSPRALIIISPFYYLLISLGIYSQRGRSTRKKLRLLALALFASILVIQFTNTFFHKLPPTKEYLLIVYNSKHP